jgi:hypothetical protein
MAIDGFLGTLRGINDGTLNISSLLSEQAEPVALRQIPNGIDPKKKSHPF